MPVLDFRVWHGSPGFPVPQTVKNPPAMKEMQETRVQPELGTSPGERNGYHSSILENPMNKGVWQAIVHGVANSRT